MVSQIHSWVYICVVPGQLRFCFDFQYHRSVLVHMPEQPRMCWTSATKYLDFPTCLDFFLLQLLAAICVTGKCSLGQEKAHPLDHVNLILWPSCTGNFRGQLP